MPHCESLMINVIIVNIVINVINVIIVINVNIVINVIFPSVGMSTYVLVLIRRNIKRPCLRERRLAVV